MCFAYFKMNKFEKNPKKYIKEKSSFLFSRGYKLKVFHRNAEYCFNFYLEGKDLDNNHIYLFYENENVDCTFSNANTAETNIKSLDIQFPILFKDMTNMEKIDFFINCIERYIEKIDIRPTTKLDYLGCEKLCIDNEQANLKEVVEEDWRLSQGDFDYIKNHVFKKQYFKSNKNNDHDHCNFCWTKITDLEIDEEHDTFGYVTLNAHGQEEWVCEKCFNDFKERFNFKVEDNNSVDKLVRYISKHDRKYYTMMLEILISLDIPDDYKWLITDVEACPKNNEVNDQFKKPLIISNKELVEMLKKDDFQWIWAVFSLFKPNVENNKIMQESPMLYSQIESKLYETPVIQHSHAILEIDAFDSSYVMITSKEAIYLEKFKKLFPQSIRQEEGDNYV